MSLSEDQANDYLLMIKDPDTPQGYPAITALLYRVCEGDQKKFEEGCRLMRLALQTGYKIGKRDS